LIVDFDLPDAAEIVKMTGLLPSQQKPLILGMTGPWPGTGQAFQSGVNRILYKPLDPAQIKDAVETSREFKSSGPKKFDIRKRGIRKAHAKSTEAKRKDGRMSLRYDVKTVVHLDFDTGTRSAIGLNISEHGFAVQATAPVPTCANLLFRCVLPNTGHSLEGLADVIWADGNGRAGLFFSHISPAARRRLRHWLRTFGHREGAVRALLPPPNASVGIALRK